ncbi:methylmalonyl Co-A mutase-associated GTPase MeaB [Halanaerobiaceae bacterium Z-7014]|uniref:Methylmalonyl Co-A mutase-associated GTPase MeaB n=1 Tax=Halonatronomonas betaini TaxID=2778430 RepID=A0A931AQP2_9FIRM|nr:methylmalonyl Co-A mutase-associated GTPase MeaB [Halonatronomonas betaini]MBF8437182.1 methylmalonyl Co-A mutase-associated GTPase MeaB [Halonatronomonas betaini]
MKIDAEKIIAGDEKTVAKAISLVENSRGEAFDLLRELYLKTELAYLLGVTGPPGGGKSTLVEKIVSRWVDSGERVAVIAIDPSSEFSGGALLGDRIRMGRIATHPDVFIRSMATRGYLGGLNPAIFDTVLVLSAAGYNRIVIETVGVGQNEIDIVSLADTTLVVTVPEAGDEIQSFKAGLMEAGDLFVLNKSDHATAHKMELILKQMIDLARSDDSGWKIPLIKTVATEEDGIGELIEKIAEHKGYLKESNQELDNKKKVMKNHLIHLLEEGLRNKYIEPLLKDEDFSTSLDDVIERKKDPYTRVSEWLSDFGEGV